MLVTLALLPVLSMAAGAFRCGSRLVQEGDSASEVRARCGEPEQISLSRILRPPVVWRNGHRYRVAGGDIEVPVETWIYNLGPNQFMQQVRLEDGFVVEIATLGYGHR